MTYDKCVWGIMSVMIALDVHDNQDFNRDRQKILHEALIVDEASIA